MCAIAMYPEGNTFVTCHLGVGPLLQALEIRFFVLLLFFLTTQQSDLVLPGLVELQHSSLPLGLPTEVDSRRLVSAFPVREECISARLIIISPYLVSLMSLGCEGAENQSVG